MGEWFIRRTEFVVDGVAPNVEPAAATGAVNPALCHPTLWIGTNEYKLGPLFVA